LICCVILWRQAKSDIYAYNSILAAFQHAPKLLLICNKTGKVICVNDMAKVVTGYTCEELQAGGLKLVVTPKMWTDYVVKYEEAARQTVDDHGIHPMRVAHIIMPLVRKDGKMLRGLFKFGTIPTRNGIELYVSVILLPEIPSLDITLDAPPGTFIDPPEYPWNLKK